MKNKLLIIAGVLVVTGAVAAGALYVYWDQAVPLAGMAINYVRYLSAPAGTLATEMAASKDAEPLAASGAPAPGPVPAAPLVADQTPGAATGNWPSYNKTLTSNRFSQLNQINKDNVGKMKVLCTYDTGQYTGFTSGLLEVNDALIAVTEYDIFSVDPTNCHQNWRTHEDYWPATPQGVNRGAAYMDDKLFRGTQDGRVLAYDFKTGKRLWETTIADPKLGESAPAAPIAWNGLVFIGNAGGDNKGVKGRMYALDAKTGKIVWEFYLVPKTEGRLDPRTARRDAARHVDMEKHVGHAHYRWRHLDVLHFRPGHRGTVHPRRQSGARLRDRPARGKQSLFRLDCGARRQDRGLREPLQACAQGLA